MHASSHVTYVFSPLFHLKLFYIDQLDTGKREVLNVNVQFTLPNRNFRECVK